MSRLCITGFGLVSSIGIGKEETLQSLLEERAGLGKVKYLATSHDEFPVGEVQLTNDAMATSLGVAPGVPMTRTALLGMMALREALDDSGLSDGELSQSAFVSGTTVGGMDKSEQYYLDFIENDSHNAYIATHDVGACSEMIAGHFGTFAIMTSLSTACSSAANALIYGARLIENGETAVAVVGGAECLSKFHLNGFNSLMILDREMCRPFDASRSGINLGEGAAYLVLEDEAHAAGRGAHIYAYLAGYGNACDAYHQTATSPDGDGAFLAMSKALDMAGIMPSQVDYINAHGTGTRDNDSSESNAMRRLFGDRVPPVSSTKSFTGHTTSASGAIEAAICLLALQHRFVPANLRWQSSDGCVSPVAATLRDVDLRHVLCNSFGFGGNDTSLLLSSEPVTPIIRKDEEGPVYIYAASQVSVQQPLSDEWMTQPMVLAEGYNRAVEPDYRQYIPPLESRRMGKLLKRAVAVGADVIAKSGIAMPDAIVSGTGLGCIDYTELFLVPLCRDGEALLKPTFFMHSTHNTVSSSLAIRLKCNGYNTTYSHKSISFDSALDDAMMQMACGEASTAMVCGFDEVTPTYYRLLSKIGFLGHPGMSSGECAAAFMLGRDGVSDVSPLCRIEGHRILCLPSNRELADAVNAMLHKAGKDTGGVEAVLMGYNGSKELDARYDALRSDVFGRMVPLHYKHLFGECYSAPALGLYAAACCLDHGVVPSLMRRDGGADMAVGSMLVVNFDDGKNCALTLLSRISE